MMLLVMLWCVGLFFSAFFSGTETGFYRVNRVRLAMDSQGGAWHTRGLLWLANNPGLFVATTLIGNNVANYLISLATVLATQRLLGDSSSAELAVTILMTPFLFVYGELLPKHFFYLAPNRLLRAASRLFLVSTVVFAPASALLWGMSRVLQRIVGQAPERVRSTLARKELQQFLEEGHEVGLLRPAQRRLAQNMFAVAGWPVLRVALPMGRLPSVRLGATRQEAQRLAERHQVPFVLVTEASGRRLMGYIRAMDLHGRPYDQVDSYRPLISISHQASLLAAIIELKSRKEVVARIASSDQKTLGLVTARRLSDALMQTS